MIDSKELAELKEKLYEVSSSSPAYVIEFPIECSKFRFKEMKESALKTISKAFWEFYKGTHSTCPEFFVTGDDFLFLIKFSVNNYFKYQEEIDLGHGFKITGEIRLPREVGIYIIYSPDFPRDFMDICGVIHEKNNGLMLEQRRYKLIKS